MAKAAKEGQISGTAGKKTFIIGADAFRALTGERFEGLNVLKLAEGEAATGLVVTQIGTQKVKGRGKDKGKVREIASYAVKAADGRTYKAPLNKSFIMKCEDAKVKVGDTIAIARGEGYTSNDGNKGVSYELVVQSRK